MSVSENQIVQFLRCLLREGHGQRTCEGSYQVGAQERPNLLKAVVCKRLSAAGVVRVDATKIYPTAATSGWVRERLAEKGTASERSSLQLANSSLAGSALARLAKPGGGGVYLQAHQVEAAIRFRALFERAALRQRVTMSPVPMPRGGGRGDIGSSDLPTMAADARRQMGNMCQALPRDCQSVLLDVCCLEKSLRGVEAERNWSRGSAKLVLRVALEQLATIFGLSQTAIGKHTPIFSAWMEPGARPDI